MHVVRYMHLSLCLCVFCVWTTIILIAQNYIVQSLAVTKRSSTSHCGNQANETMMATAGSSSSGCFLTILYHTILIVYIWWYFSCAHIFRRSRTNTHTHTSTQTTLQSTRQPYYGHRAIPSYYYADLEPGHSVLSYNRIASHHALCILLYPHV